MDIYLPTLEARMIVMVAAFRFIVFTIMVVGLLCLAVGSRGRALPLVTILAKAIVIVAAVALMDQWFPKVERIFVEIANYIDPGYTENPTSSADAIRESTTANPEGKEWSWRHLNESIYQAVSSALANIFIYIGTLITVPMLILQYVLRWLLYLVTPFALAIFMLPGFAGIGVRFFQQLLAIFAWPIGFALTNLVALSIWKDFREAVGANPASVSDALYSPLLTFMGGILATIMIIVGTISTPVVMQMLFAQGYAFTGSSVRVTDMVRSGANLVYGSSARTSSRGSAVSATPMAASTARVAPPPTAINLGGI